VAETARAVEAAGADGLSLVNTIRGLALDERTLRPRLGTAVGGLSGPALRPIALAAVWACYRATSLPIVGMGGVSTGRDALELIAAGATDVALGTILFADPDAPARIRQELDAEAAALGFAGPAQARGVAHGEARSLDERSRVEAEKALELAPNLPLDRRDSGASIPRRGLAEDASPSAGPLARPAHGRA
jgi:2,4-dienoyl-CoA reductase-like NADH-dependent reductase (Old Yellow Enzyme family)